jgi:uridine kinase
VVPAGTGVSVDGITVAGKTTVAREFAAAVGERGRVAVHLSMDGFHHHRAHRHRQGWDSAIGYYDIDRPVPRRIGGRPIPY